MSRRSNSPRAKRRRRVDPISPIRARPRRATRFPKGLAIAGPFSFRASFPPKLHGLAVLRALREDARTRDITVLVCSAKDFRTERDEARALGAADFLVKPTSPRVLVERV